VKPAPFAYVAAASRQEALETLAANPYEAKAIAGGQSLIPLMALRFAQVELLVDLNRIDDMAFVREHDGGLAVGAMTRARDVERSPLVAAGQPLLVEALRLVGHSQIRNRGTVGGSCAHADPTAEMPTAAVALEASMVAACQGGERVIPASEFFVTHFTTALEQEELLTEIRFPALPARSGCAFIEVSRRHGDFALVATACVVTLDDAGRCARVRVVIAGAGDRPVDVSDRCGALIGEAPTESRVREAALEATADLDPSSDIHASSSYRKRVAGVLVRRAVLEAAGRAGAVGATATARP
jgi:carbon-monoxide dehydrogenase medium subunit